jgi:hypothetical protein
MRILQRFSQSANHPNKQNKGRIRQQMIIFLSVWLIPTRPPSGLANQTRVCPSDMTYDKASLHKRVVKSANASLHFEFTSKLAQKRIYHDIPSETVNTNYTPLSPHSHPHHHHHPPTNSNTFPSIPIKNYFSGLVHISTPMSLARPHPTRSLRIRVQLHRLPTRPR